MLASIIKLKDSNRVGEVYQEILKELENSRFKSEVSTNKNNIKFSTIRLKVSKPYCGNHAGSCKFTGNHKPHRKAIYLEGCDWVGFNDMLNDILDRTNVEANIASSTCIVRKGLERRYRYSGTNDGEFLKDENCYMNLCGKEPIPSTFQNGTPGIASYKIKDSLSQYVEDCVKVGKEPYLD
jgi:hypothetical protein